MPGNPKYVIYKVRSMRKIFCLKRDEGLSALADRPSSSTELNIRKVIRAHHKQPIFPPSPA